MLLHWDAIVVARRAVRLRVEIEGKTMAEAKTDNLFGRSAMSRIASADELDHYVKVTNPSAWVILVAALLLVGGILVWALVAVVPVTVETTGVNLEGNDVYCWVNKATAKKIQESGATAKVGDATAVSVTVGDLPMSSSEVVHFLGSDFITSALNLDDWNYLVQIEVGEGLQHTEYTIQSLAGDTYLVPVSITVSEKNPIFIVMGKE